MRLSKFLCSAALSFTVALATAQTSGTATASGQRTGMADTPSTVGKSDHMFMTKTAQSGMMEVQAAEMAMQKAQSEEVKQYARKLKDDHTAANEKLMAIAKERGVQLPADMGPHQAMMSRMNNFSGADFDRAFMRAQVEHHKKDIKEFQKEANRGMDSDLKAFASSTLPTLEEHLRMAQNLANSTGTGARKSDMKSDSKSDMKSDTKTETR